MQTRSTVKPNWFDSLTTEDVNGIARECYGLAVNYLRVLGAPDPQEVAQDVVAECIGRAFTKCDPANSDLYTERMKQRRETADEEDRRRINDYLALPEGYRAVRSFVRGCVPFECHHAMRTYKRSSFVIEVRDPREDGLNAARVDFDVFAMNEYAKKGLTLLNETDHEIVLRTANGETQEEIAMAMGMSPNTVNVRLVRVRQKMRKRFDIER